MRNLTHVYVILNLETEKFLQHLGKVEVYKDKQKAYRDLDDLLINTGYFIQTYLNENELTRPLLASLFEVTELIIEMEDGWEAIYVRQG